MKKYILVLLSLLMIGCASVKKDICQDLRDRMPDKPVVITSKMELQKFLFWKGAELAQEMHNANNEGRQCVEAHIFMTFNNIESYGEVCAELREDGFYFIETSCDYRAGEEIKRRDHLERKVEGQ